MYTRTEFTVHGGYARIGSFVHSDGRRIVCLASVLEGAEQNSGCTSVSDTPYLLKVQSGVSSQCKKTSDTDL